MSIKSGTGRRWGYAVAVWGVLFAIPSFVWAAGSTFGARSTVAPELVRLAQDRVPWFLAVLWVTGFLKLLGAAIGLGLSRPRGRLAGRSLVFCGGGAAVLLIWHGGLFVVHGLLVGTGTVTVDPDLAGLTHWYLCLWGPWFLAGGLAFAAATAHHLQSGGRRFAATGALGALLLSAAATATGIG
ncbi:DUF3995 domain-containing protein [Kitasatospora purpeofusca]|uniref:DUF3995 domain-containing protein n=1 Tax=Kitasatospora purpeofusca TaxID=67352 RepID=UPI0033DD0F3C